MELKISVLVFFINNNILYISNDRMYYFPIWCVDRQEKSRKKWKKQIRINQNSKITYFSPSVACFLSKINEVIISVNPDGSTGWRTALQFICQKCQIGCQISAFGKCVSRISSENDLPVTCGGQWGAKAPFLASFRCRCNWKWRKLVRVFTL